MSENRSTLLAEPTRVPVAVRTGSARRRSMRSSKRTVLVVFLLVLTIAWAYPFIWLLSASLKSNSEIFSQGLALVPEQLAVGNYARAWTAANFSKFLMNTVILSVVSTAIAVTVSAMAGYSIGRFRLPFKRLIVVFLVATLFVPTGFTIIPLFDLAQRLNLTQSLLGIILVESSRHVVLFILLFASFFSTVPREVEEAAIVDGASVPQMFARVMLPLAMPTIAATSILQFIASWNSFFIPLVFTLGKPDLRTVSVGMTVFVGEYSTDWGGMAAAATISILPLIVVFIIFQRWFVEGLAGAVKG